MSYLTFRDSSKLNKNRLDHRFSNHFNSDSLLDKISLDLCSESILSKKEYCESVEIVRIIQRYLSGKKEVILYDICGGHGFTGILAAALCQDIEKSFIIDTKPTVAYDKLIKCISKNVKNIANKVDFISEDFNTLTYKTKSLLIGVHACGIRTDQIINLAIENESDTIVLPCCYKKKLLPGDLKKFADIYELKDLVDFYRITKLLELDYKVSIKLIPEQISPMNKVFIIKRTPQEQAPSLDG